MRDEQNHLKTFGSTPTYASSPDGLRLLPKRSARSRTECSFNRIISLFQPLVAKDRPISERCTSRHPARVLWRPVSVPSPLRRGFRTSPDRGALLPWRSRWASSTTSAEPAGRRPATDAPALGCDDDEPVCALIRIVRNRAMRIVARRCDCHRLFFKLPYG